MRRDDSAAELPERHAKRGLLTHVKDISICFSFEDILFIAPETYLSWSACTLTDVFPRMHCSPLLPHRIFFNI